MNKFKCSYCGNHDTTTRPQTFKNGSVHMREECANCGAYVRYHKQDNSTFRQQQYTILKNLALLDERFLSPKATLLVMQARQLLEDEKTRYRSRSLNDLNDQKQLDLAKNPAYALDCETGSVTLAKENQDG